MKRYQKAEPMLTPRARVMEALQRKQFFKKMRNVERELLLSLLFDGLDKFDKIAIKHGIQTNPTGESKRVVNADFLARIHQTRDRLMQNPEFARLVKDYHILKRFEVEGEQK